MPRHLVKGERPLNWVGSSKRNFLEFPSEVIDEMGNALGVAQFGGTHPSAKPWKGEGHDGNAYRAIYTVRFKEAIYVLHAFQKKSPRGIKTARADVELIGARLKAAQADHEERYAQGKA
jgi:phage-related protein